jgi:hypothetical protein
VDGAWLSCEILNVGWIEDSLLSHEFQNHFIKGFVERPKQMERMFVLWAHCPIIFIPCSWIVIKYPFELSKDEPPFFLTWKAIFIVLRTTYIHDISVICFPFHYCYFKLISWVHIARNCNVLLLFCLDQGQHLISMISIRLPWSSWMDFI